MHTHTSGRRQPRASPRYSVSRPDGSAGCRVPVPGRSSNGSSNSLRGAHRRPGRQALRPAAETGAARRPPGCARSAPDMTKGRRRTPRRRPSGERHLFRYAQNSSNDRTLSPLRSRALMMTSAIGSVTCQSPPWARAVLKYERSRLGSPGLQRWRSSSLRSGDSMLRRLRSPSGAVAAPRGRHRAAPPPLLPSPVLAHRDNRLGPPRVRSPPGAAADYAPGSADLPMVVDAVQERQEITAPADIVRADHATAPRSAPGTGSRRSPAGDPATGHDARC